VRFIKPLTIHKTRIRVKLSCSLAVLLIAAFQAPAQCTFAQVKSSAKPSEPINVLFVGNSYTGVNNLPLMFSRLSEAGAKPKVRFKTSLRGGWTLRKHWTEEKPATKKTIKDGNFNYVIIQEQSQIPFANPKVTHEFGVKLGELARAKGATPVFYMTWARLNQPDNQSKITAAYRRLGEKVNTPVAPVGLAWESVLKNNKNIELHRSDKSHPTPAGTYLAACVFYGTIHKESPVGLPARLYTEPSNKGKIAVQLTNAKATLLQQAAWKAVQEEIMMTNQPANK
jgi:hypothetical protein